MSVNVNKCIRNLCDFYQKYHNRLLLHSHYSTLLLFLLLDLCFCFPLAATLACVLVVHSSMSLRRDSVLSDVFSVKMKSPVAGAKDRLERFLTHAADQRSDVL